MKVVVANGAAASGRCRKALPDVVEALARRGVAVTVRWTDGPGHATALAAEAAAQGAESVIAAGGDGTLFEVVNGLAAGPAGPTLGVLPLGTGNSFARDFGLHETLPAITALVDGRSRPVDRVRADSDQGPVWSINLFSLGFTARAGALTNARFKGMGAGGYAMAVVACLARPEFPSFRHRRDGGPWDDAPVSLISFSNSRYTGGSMAMAPAADPCDGELDVIIVRPMSRARFLGAFPRIYRGTHPKLAAVQTGRARQVEFDLGAEVDAMIDGEIVRRRWTGLTVEPGALRFVTGGA